MRARTYHIMGTAGLETYARVFLRSGQAPPKAPKRRGAEPRRKFYTQQYSIAKNVGAGTALAHLHPTTERIIMLSCHNVAEVPPHHLQMRRVAKDAVVHARTIELEIGLLYEAAHRHVRELTSTRRVALQERVAAPLLVV